MHGNPDTPLCPCPQFADRFRSCFEDGLDLKIGSSVVPFSPLSRDVGSFLKTVTVMGRVLQTLNLENLQKSRIWDKEARIFYPSRDVPETTWKNIRLLRVDYTNRRDGMTSLFWAAHIGDMDGMKRLLSSGANADRQLQNGNTVLMETIAGNPNKRFACVKALLDHGIRINIENEAGHTAFTAATSIGDVTIVKHLFLNYKCSIDINHKTKHGSTALMLAIAGNHKEIVEYLLNFDVDLLHEDRDNFTALCWAQVLNPSLAGLVSLRLGVEDKLISFIRRRIELLQSRSGNIPLFGLFYHLSFLLLNFEIARCTLIKDGILRKMTFHPIWEGLQLNEHEKNYQILPWFMALSCAMMCDEKYPLQYFIANGAGEILLEDVNDMLENTPETEQKYTVQSMIFPLMAWEPGRDFITTKGFKYRNILDLFADPDNILTNNASEVFKKFQEFMNTHLDKYTLKIWKRKLGEQVRKVCKEPTMCVSNRLKTVYSHFETLRDKARDIVGNAEQEDYLRQAAEEEEKRKIEKQRARKNDRRERRRIQFNEIRENCAKNCAKEERRKVLENPKPSPVPCRTNVCLDLYTEAAVNVHNNQKSPVNASKTVFPPIKKNPPKEPNTPEVKPVAPPRNKIPPCDTYSKRLQGQDQKRTPTKETRSRVPPTPQERRREFAAAKQNRVEKETKKVKDQSAPKPASNSPAAKEKSPEKKPPVRENQKEQQEIYNRINKQIDEDFLYAMSMQEKLNRGMDAVTEEKIKPKVKMNITETSQIENAKEKTIVSDDNNLNQKEHNIKNLKEKMSHTNFPSLPKKAILVEDLEKVKKRHSQSDPEISKPVNSSETKEMPPPDVTSSGDGPNNVKTKIDEDSSKLTPMIPWVKRSVRWRSQLETLLSLPSNQREKAAALNFCFSRHDLIIASGSEGTVVAVGIRDDGTEVAVKRMLKTHSRHYFEEMKNMRLPEFEIGNIVQYKDYAEDAHFGYLAMELCEYTLDEYMIKLQKEGKLQEHSKRLVKELFEGLNVLHSAKVLHRDLKPRNVLIDIRGTLKLADFGVSKMMNEDESTIYQSSAFGTRCWRPTEVLRALQLRRSVPYKPASDIQVAGMIAYFIISGGKHPYGQDPAQCEINIRDSKPVALLDEKDDTLLGWLAGTIHFDPKKRRTAKQVLLHPFFWPIERKFEFLQKVKLQSEVRMRVPCKNLRILESAASWIGCENWLMKQDKFHMNQMQLLGFKYTDSVVDFLCFVVDTDEVFSEIPVHLQTLIGDPVKHFLTAYPRLFIATFEIVRDSDWKDRRNLTDFFEPRKESL